MHTNETPDSNPASRWQWNCPARLAIQIDALADELELTRPLAMRLIVGQGLAAVRRMRRLADQRDHIDHSAHSDQPQERAELAPLRQLAPEHRGDHTPRAVTPEGVHSGHTLLGADPDLDALLSAFGQSFAAE